MTTEKLYMLQEKLCELIHFKGLTTYNVIENFKKSGMIEYQVSLIDVEFENNNLIFIDEEDKWLSGKNKLWNIMISSIERITYYKSVITIYFKDDGFIKLRPDKAA